MVSERFPSGFGVFQTCPKTCPGLSRVFEPSSCPEGFVPGFWALKAVRRVVRGFVWGSCPADFVPSKLSGGLFGGLSGGLSGVLSPFGPNI